MLIRELCINWEGYSATWRHIRIGSGSLGKNDCAAQQISVSDAGAFLLQGKAERFFFVADNGRSGT
jgi:hypothetical protein